MKIIISYFILIIIYFPVNFNLQSVSLIASLSKLLPFLFIFLYSLFASLLCSCPLPVCSSSINSFPRSRFTPLYLAMPCHSFPLVIFNFLSPYSLHFPPLPISICLFHSSSLFLLIIWLLKRSSFLFFLLFPTPRCHCFIVLSSYPYSTWVTSASSLRVEFPNWSHRAHRFLRKRFLPGTVLHYINSFSFSWHASVPFLVLWSSDEYYY